MLIGAYSVIQYLQTFIVVSDITTTREEEALCATLDTPYKLHMDAS